ncbi:hypothetical protein M2103_001058 [Ereboglobus sp. PH5-5]|uniref:hypothetical protein n=1 Tax=unclassified Ereboglobus TaxID=2626932 RepID=UPI0024059E4C|nr:MULTISPECIES: hypothetical protein [unclassified Ereboglobus]MDF9827708.1 hypothetical protein [Ereboglobus sp. PH5-10]MDF9832844.1 hypothetical protein [Ereboglobus sp. PH5-5]
MSTRRIIFVLIALGCVAMRAGVSTDSPFVPRGSAAAGKLANNTPIELRAIVSDENGPRFAIYDPAKKEGIWVSVDEPGQSFVVRSYDAATNRINVDYQGRTQTIALVEPKFGPGKSIAVSAPAPAGVARAGAAQPVQGRASRANSSGQQNTQQRSADEAKRLEAIRAEVARRRAQREASAQQNQQRR